MKPHGTKAFTFINNRRAIERRRRANPIREARRQKFIDKMANRIVSWEATYTPVRDGFVYAGHKIRRRLHKEA